MADSVAIPPRRWFGFISEPDAPSTGAATAKIEPRELVAVASRRWLDFIPEPGSYRTAATWGVPAVGAMLAVGLVVGVLAAGGEAQGNESDGAAMEDADAPDQAGEEIANASAIATPATIVEPDDPPPVLEAAVTVDNAAADPAPPPTSVRKRVVIEPMTPAQLRRAQRVAKQLDAALSDGRVKTSSLSFAVVADAEGNFWSDASTLCAELVVDGVAGWRLPSVGELRDLGRARAIPGAAFWSRSHGRDPESAMVYNVRTRHSGAWLKTEPTGATVCVQPRPRAGDDQTSA